MTPTARTLKALREMGMTADVVERWIPGANIRRDFGGFADVLAFSAGQPGVLAIQTTTGANAAARVKKIRGLLSAAEWRAAGNRIEIWSWSKRGERGERKIWTLKRESL